MNSTLTGITTLGACHYSKMPKPPPKGFPLPSHLLPTAEHVELLYDSEEVCERELQPPVSRAGTSDSISASSPRERVSRALKQMTEQTDLEHGLNRETTTIRSSCPCRNGHITEWEQPPSSSIVHRKSDLHRTVSHNSNSSGTRSVSRSISVHSNKPKKDTLSRWPTHDLFAITNHRESRQNPVQSYKESNSGLLLMPENLNGTQSRKTTKASIANSFAPESIQRRFTNASYLRRSSIWNTYQKAKHRAVQLQRNERTQLLFEYSVYLTLVAFVYFVLVGVPLWKGAVYWLWWVVAHKFVIAGGFSITLGIAFL